MTAPRNRAPRKLVSDAPERRKNDARVLMPSGSAAPLFLLSWAGWSAFGGRSATTARATVLEAAAIVTT